MKYFKLFSIMITVFVLSACSTIREVGSERIVEAYPSKKPEWISLISKVDVDKKIVQIRSSSTGSRYLEEAELVARTSGLRELGFLAGTYITTQGGLIQDGQIRDKDGLTNAFNSVVNVSSKATFIYGMFVPETYYEKVETVTTTGLEYTYNVHIKTEISKNDFDKIVSRLAEAAIDSLKKAKYIEAKKILEDGQQWLNKEIGKWDTL